MAIQVINRPDPIQQIVQTFLQSMMMKQENEAQQERLKLQKDQFKLEQERTQAALQSQQIQDQLNQTILQERQAGQRAGQASLIAAIQAKNPTALALIEAAGARPNAGGVLTQNPGQQFAGQTVGVPQPQVRGQLGGIQPQNAAPAFANFARALDPATAAGLNIARREQVAEKLATRKAEAEADKADLDLAFGRATFDARTEAVELENRKLQAAIQRDQADTRKLNAETERIPFRSYDAMIQAGMNPTWASMRAFGLIRPPRTKAELDAARGLQEAAYQKAIAEGHDPADPRFGGRVAQITAGFAMNIPDSVIARVLTALDSGTLPGEIVERARQQSKGEQAVITPLEVAQINAFLEALGYKPEVSQDTETFLSKLLAPLKRFNEQRYKAYSEAYKNGPATILDAYLQGVAERSENAQGPSGRAIHNLATER